MRRFLRPAAIAVLLLAASGPAAAAGEAGPVIHGIGRVEVVTPGRPGAGPGPLFTEAAVRGWLTGLAGEPLDEVKARRLVERHYRYLGYEPETTFQVKDGLLEVRVVEAPGVVESVTVGPEPLEGRVPDRLLEGMEPVTHPHIPLRALRTRPGALISREKIARDAYDLSRMGYDLVPVPGEEGRYAVTRLAPPEDWEAVKAKMAGDGEPPIGPDRNQWVSVEAEYTRRSLLVARVFYTRSDLFREFDRLEVSPYVAQKPAGAIAYHIPYILPSSFTRLDVFARVKLYDEFVPDRILEGVETDERRVGARLAMGVEPARHARRHTLSAQLWIDRYHVDFGRSEIPIAPGPISTSSDVPGGSLNDLNVVGVEMDWRISHEDRAPRFWWRFLPRLEVATKQMGGDVAYRQMSGELKQHYAWSTGFEVDMSWKGGMTDREVPVFEQFALGGADSLRGFLRDDFIGRNFWSAQHDLWIPIPFRAFGRESRLMASLQRSLKTAIILDAGSIDLEETLDAGFARGVGIGLRWKSEESPLVVKIDAAWGRWNDQDSFYPYISFSRSW